MTTVMIVDDNEAIRAACHAMLDKSGYRILEAENGKAAIKLLGTEPVDVVLTDIIMPEQEGFETIRVLSKEYPGVKIIAMSGGGCISAEEYLGVAKKLGANGTLQKPFKKAELQGMVRTLIETAPIDCLRTER
jgi:CheY-like chemotaxis protein